MMPCVISANSSGTEPQPTLLTPEMFGAVGDGVEDDYDALVSLATAASTSAEEVHVLFGKERTYFISQVKDIGSRRVRVSPFGENGVNDVIYGEAFSGYIMMNGATILHDVVNRDDDNGDFPYSKTASVTPFFFDRSADAKLVGPGFVKGPAQLSSLGDGVTAGPCHGIVSYGVAKLSISNIEVAYWQADGVWIGAYLDEATGQRRTAGKVETVGIHCHNNARMGITDTGCEDWTDKGSTFEASGDTAYGAHNPSLAVDIEILPRQSAESRATLEGSILENNMGGVLAVSDNYSFGVTAKFKKCQLHRDMGLTKLRAVSAYAMTGKNAKVTYEECLLSNVGIRTSDGLTDVVRSKWANFDPETLCIFGFRDSVVNVSDSEFSIDPQTAVRFGSVRIDTGSFVNNNVAVSRSASNGAANQNIAQFGVGCSASGNAWETDQTGPGSFAVTYRGASSSETHERGIVGVVK